MKKKELFWFISTTILVLILNTLIFGFDGLNADATLDINIHDTYFVLQNFHFIILLGVLVFFGVYLVRTLRSNFKNLTANLILMIATLLLILVLIGFDSILDAFIRQTTSWSIYPPLSAGEVEQDFKPKETNLSALSCVLFFTKILLLIFLAFCGFKTGQNYKRNK